MSNKTTPVSDTPATYLDPLRSGDVNVPIIAVDIPVMYEDEGQDELGDTDVHRRCCEILRNGLIAHFGEDSEYRVFSDLNIYYHPIDRWSYVSPDTCAVVPSRKLPDHVTSYRVGKDGSAPIVTMEVLSKRSAQQQDLTNKLEIYSFLEVPEYIVVDVTGEFLTERLLLKELDEDGSWITRQDPDGGVTSRLGFRVIIDDDGMIRVVNAKTGVRYPRPDEAYAEVKKAEDAKLLAERAKQEAEQEIQKLKEELARLKGKKNGGSNNGS